MDAKWITPSVTVFRQDGPADMDGCSKVYDNLVAKGIDGILVLGSLGEFFAIPLDEKKEIIRNAVASVGGAVPIIAGTNCMVMQECIELSNFALKEGAAAVMIIPPYYFTLPDRAIEHFYGQIAARVDGPIYLYNFPAVMGYDLKPDVILNLALSHKNIVGIKDTISNMDHTRAIINLVRENRADFEVFSGFDEFLGHNVLSGGSGCIGGISNFAPEIASGFIKTIRSNDSIGMAEYQQKIDSLMPIYGIGGQFSAPIKKAMVLRGIIDSDACTAPLLPATEEETTKVRLLLEKTGLL